MKKAIITALLTPFCLIADDICKPDVHSDMIYFKHVEGKGYGYNEGYSTLGAFITPYSTFSQVLPFLDLRGHVFNRHWKFAANAGAGIKWLSDSPLVVGAAAYYDYRQTHQNHYNQVGLSFEFLCDRWEIRANGYLPVGAKTHAKTISETVSYAFEKFAGHSLFYTTTYDIHRKVEFAMKGVDGEVGFHLMKPQEFYTVYLGAGPYYFHSPHGLKKHAFGGQARVQARITPYLTLQISDSWDNLFHNKFQGEISVNIPFGGRILKKNSRFDASCAEVLSMEARMVQPMHRNEIIVADKVKRHEYKTIDPIAQSIYGGPLNFIFVNANAPSGGDGTFENPYNDLFAASTASYPNNVFYVSGDFTIESNEVLLINNQSFLGSAIPQAVPIQATPSTVATLTIPPMTSTAPSLTMPPTNVNNIIYANGDNIVVSGIIFNQSISGEAAGVINFSKAEERWYPIQNITIVNNTFNIIDGGAGDGIFLDSVSGTALIQNNTFNGNLTGQNAINFGELANSDTLSGNYVVDLKILDNTFNSWARISIYVQANTATDGASIINALIQNNNSTGNPNNPGTGILIEASNHGTINGTILNNIANNNYNNGLQIISVNEATVNITACNNNLSFNGGSGIFIDAEDTAIANLVLCNNSLLENSNSGIRTSPGGGTQTAVSLTALVTGNVITSSSEGGVIFQQAAGGSVTSKLTFENNTLIDNGGGNGGSFVLYNEPGSTTTVFLNGNINTNFGYALFNYNTNPLSFNIEQGGTNYGIITLEESTSPQTGPYNIVPRHTAAP